MDKVRISIEEQIYEIPINMVIQALGITVFIYLQFLRG